MTVIEIFSSALRWGFPSIVSTLALVSHFTVYQTIFPFLFIVFSSGAYAIALIYSDVLKVRYKYNMTAIIAILLNGSIFFFFYEGFYPSIFGLIYFNLIISLLLVRSNQKQLVQIILLASLLLASLITLYSELYVLGLVFFAGYLFICLLKREYINIQFTLWLLIAFVIAFFLVSPLSLKIVGFTFRNAGNIGHIGYAQPTWMAPSDYLGLTNIFSYSATRRSILMAIFAFLFSGWGLYEYRKWIKNSLVLTVLIGIVEIFMVNLLLIHFMNYQPYNYLYNKLVTDFSPTLITFFFFAIMQHKNVVISKKKVLFAVICIFISTGALISHQVSHRGRVDIYSMNKIKNEFDFRNNAFISNAMGYRHGINNSKIALVDRASDLIISVNLKDRVIDQWDLKAMESLNRRLKLLFLVQKKNLLNKENFYKYFKKQIVFNTPGYFVIKSGITVGQLKKGNRAHNIQQLLEKLKKVDRSPLETWPLFH